MDTIDLSVVKQPNKEKPSPEEIAKEFATLGDYREAMKQSYRETVEQQQSKKG